MNDKIKLVIEYKKDKENTIFEKIVEQYEKTIKYYVKKLPINVQDDMEQLILMKLDYIIKEKFEIIYDLPIDNFIEVYENIVYYQKNTEKLINEKIKYVISFHKMYNEIISNKSLTTEEIEYEFILFCNERRLNKYLYTSFQRLCIDIGKKVMKIKENEGISLNMKIHDNIELQEIVEDKNKEKEFLYDENVFLPEEKKLLIYFYVENLSASKIGKILGITKQAVSKKKRKILEKYKINLK